MRPFRLTYPTSARVKVLVAIVEGSIADLKVNVETVLVVGVKQGSVKASWRTFALLTYWGLR